MCQTLKIKNLSVSLLPITVSRISLRLRSESRDSRSRLSCHRDRQSDALSISLASEKGRKKESCLRERRREGEEEEGSGHPHARPAQEWRQFIHIHSKGEGRKRHFLHSNYGQEVRARHSPTRNMFHKGPRPVTKDKK